MSIKSGAVEHTKFYDQIPKLWKEHLLTLKKKERKKVLLLLKEAVQKDDLENVDTALELSRLYGKTDTESVRQCYYNLVLDNSYKPPCNITADVPNINYEPNLNPYDHLLGKEVV